jgi:hypothetical protein
VNDLSTISTFVAVTDIPANSVLVNGMFVSPEEANVGNSELLKDGRLVFIQGSIEAQIGTRWTFRFSSDYNMDTGTVIENRLEVEFREQCWGVIATYINRVDENEFRITLTCSNWGNMDSGGVRRSVLPTMKVPSST